MKAPTHTFRYSNLFLAAALGVAKSLKLLFLINGVVGSPAAPSEHSGHQFFKTLSFSSPGLLTLALSRCGLDMTAPLQGTYQLNCLQHLSIEKAVLSDDSFTSLVKLCPGLSTLSLQSIMGLERPRVESPSLVGLSWMSGLAPAVESMVINTPQLGELLLPKAREAYVDAPLLNKLELTSGVNLEGVQAWNLNHLEIRGFGWEKQQLVHLMEACIRSAGKVELNVGSLQCEEALLLAELLNPVQDSVQELHISESIIANLDLVPNQGLPVLQSLQKLEVRLDAPDVEIHFCEQLLELSPNLESFVIDVGAMNPSQHARGLFENVLRIQRQYPRLDLRVERATVRANQDH